MAGVRFEIWIPCRKYEEILSNKRISGETTSDDEDEKTMKVKTCR